MKSIPIGQEAFVFFVDKENPVNNLRTEQIKLIYSGEITNWKQLGGHNRKIFPFQKAKDTQGQQAMLQLMGDTPLQKPYYMEIRGGVGGHHVIVAEYRVSPGALGYSFRKFIAEMTAGRDELKILNIDGVAPTVENIQNGSYPHRVTIYANYKPQDEDQPHVREIMTWLQSEQGQELVKKSGFAPIQEHDEL